MIKEGILLLLSTLGIYFIGTLLILDNDRQFTPTSFGTKSSIILKKNQFMNNQDQQVSWQLLQLYENVFLDESFTKNHKIQSAVRLVKNINTVKDYPQRFFEVSQPVNSQFNDWEFINRKIVFVREGSEKNPFVNHYGSPQRRKNGEIVYRIIIDFPEKNNLNSDQNTHTDDQEQNNSPSITDYEQQTQQKEINNNQIEQIKQQEVENQVEQIQNPQQNQQEEQPKYDEGRKIQLIQIMHQNQQQKQGNSEFQEHNQQVQQNEPTVQQKYPNQQQSIDQPVINQNQSNQQVITDQIIEQMQKPQQQHAGDQIIQAVQEQPIKQQNANSKTNQQISDEKANESDEKLQQAINPGYQPQKFINSGMYAQYPPENNQQVQPTDNQQNSEETMQNQQMLNNQEVQQIQQQPEIVQVKEQGQYIHEAATQDQPIQIDQQRIIKDLQA